MVHARDHPALDLSKGDDLVKKVRYALAAVGVVPALGLAAPLATAAAHTPTSTGKTVRPTTTTTAPCSAHAAKLVSNPDGGGIYDYTVYVHWSRDIGCIGSVNAFDSDTSATGLWLRERFYNGGVLKKEILNKNGHIHTGGLDPPVVSWQSSPRISKIQNVCFAVVSSAHLQVKAGPVCQPTGF
jgi:hypothetical protein